MKPVTSTLRSLRALADAGLVAPDRVPQLEDVTARYAVAITPAMAELIDPVDPNDPIARQFVPDAAERDMRPDELADPLGDETHSPVEGLVHRFPDRVLLKIVNVCAVYCRFCFRREMIGPGKPNALSAKAFSAAVKYIESDPNIWEVILSGGDPLVLTPRRLAAAIKRLAAIPHVKVLRIHTRIPAVAPARITPALVRSMKVRGKAVYVVLHANHARELTPAARAACARIVDAGIPMLSQSVLLKGVNDNVEELGALMRAFVECRIKPYYLHHLDRAPGTAQFRTSLARGRDLMRKLRERRSGLCQPAYVIDAQGRGKQLITPYGSI